MEIRRYEKQKSERRQGSRKMNTMKMQKRKKMRTAVLFFRNKKNKRKTKLSIMNVDDERYTNEFTIQPYYSFNTRSRQTINPFSRSMSYPLSRSLYTCTRTYIFLAKSQTLLDDICGIATYCCRTITLKFQRRHLRSSKAPRLVLSSFRFIAIVDTLRVFLRSLYLTMIYLHVTYMSISIGWFFSSFARRIFSLLDRLNRQRATRVKEDRLKRRPTVRSSPCAQTFALSAFYAVPRHLAEFDSSICERNNG